MTWACPECGSDDIGVTVITSANLIQESNGNFQTEVQGDHEWDNDSTMWCHGCGHVSTGHAFELSASLLPGHPDGPMAYTSKVYGRRRHDECDT